MTNLARIIIGIIGFIVLVFGINIQQAYMKPNHVVIMSGVPVIVVGAIMLLVAIFVKEK